MVLKEKITESILGGLCLDVLLRKSKRIDNRNEVEKGKYSAGME